MDAFFIDLRFGARMLIKRPGFWAIAVATLAVGIGANTTIFSFVNSILLRPLPYADAERIVVPQSFNVSRNSDDASASITYADYLDWKAAGIFEHVAVLNLLSSADLTSGEGEPERVGVASVSREYFDVMGAQPLLGRTFVDADYEETGPARALMISYGLWQRRFGGDAGVVGKDIYLNGRPYPLVGVMPKDSLWPDDRDIIAPFAVGPNPGPDLMRRDNMIFAGLARLRPDVPVEQVNSTMATIAARLEQDDPQARTGWSNRVVGLREYVVGNRLRTSLIILLATVCCVLLIACVNVANLLLVRASAREREMAIRVALGAGRLRLLRQLLTESLLLTSVGAGAGLLLAIWGVELLKVIAPADTPRLREVRIDAGVLIFTLAVALATSIVCGMIPAVQIWRTDLQTSLKESSRGSTGGTRTRRLRAALVISEVALALLLLVGAGLMVRSFIRVQGIDPGLQTNRLLTMQLYAPGLRYPTEEQVVAFYRELLDRVRSAPGVESVAVSSALPLGGGGFYLGRVFLREDQAEPPASSDFPAQWNVVSPAYFFTAGVGIIRGREFDDRDTASGRKVIIINQTLARRMFGDGDPIGRRIRSWRDENQLREIVGVVEDVRYFGRDDDLRGLVYVPHSQSPWRTMTLNIRTRNDPSTAIAGIRAQISGLDRQLAVANLATMTSILNRSVASRRASMLLLVVFGINAALLAVIGIYGVLSYSVAQREQEIGVRIALGAQRGDVLRMVIKHGMKLTAAGVGIGLIAAYAITRLMTTLLYSVSPTDPVTYALVAALLSLVALVACYVPSRRATKVDPIVALRCE